MKVTLAFLIAVFQATLLQSGCQNRFSTADSKATEASSTDQVLQDRELLKNVEQFAGGGSESPSAWQNLMSHERQKLINDLTRISDALPAKDRKRVLIAYTFCKMRHEYVRNREIVLSALSKRSPYKDLYGDWVVTMVGSLVIDGDRELLPPLFKASEWADGAMGTDLAYAYSEALLLDTENFLVLLSSESEYTRGSVVNLLHHHSLTTEQNQRIKEYLKTVAPSSNLAPVAGQILKTLSN